MLFISVQSVLRFLFLSIVFLMISLSVSAESIFYDSELNIALEGEKWGLAGRLHEDRYMEHYIAKYKPRPDWQFQYRYVVRKDREQLEHRFRLTQKTFNSDNFLINTVFEHRERESRSDNIRFRPDFILQEKITGQATLFYQFTPHWVYDFTSRETEYSFAWHKVGIKISIDRSLKFNLFARRRTDSAWDVIDSFWGVDISKAL